MNRPGALLLLSLAACATDDPTASSDPTSEGGKADGGGKTIEVAVEECGGSPFDLCPYVQSAPCGLVTLHDAHDKEVARGYTSDGGRLTFQGLAKGKYTAKVHKRDGTLATMMLNEVSSATTPAKVGVDVTAGETPWARFELAGGTAAGINACAELRGNLTVKDHAGHVIDRNAVEWDWLVELESNGAVARTRPLFFYQGGANHQDANIVDFRMIHPGAHTLRFVRMNIPSYAQKPNPDYAQLRASYSANVPPIEVPITVAASAAGHEVSITRTIVDPQAP